MPNEPHPSDPQSGEPADVETLLLHLPLPVPRAEFQRELRRRFLVGDVRFLVGDVEGALGSPAALGERTGQRKVLAPAPATRGSRLVLGGIAAAAAAVLAITFLVGEREPVTAPAWTLRGADAASAGLLDAANVGAEWTHSGDQPVDLVLAKGFVVRVLPRTRFTPPALEQLAAALPLRFELEAGELLIRTCGSYAGPPIEVESPDALVRITGTAVSVMKGEAGTCVCVSDGTVLTHQFASGRQDPVGPAETWFAFAEPHPNFGVCHREAFEGESVLLGEKAIEHIKPLKALVSEPLFH